MALVNILRNLILAAGLLAPAAAFADDIDLFKGGTPITGQKPNVLIIVDNSANWNRNDQGWPIGKQGESELQAMSNVIGSLTGDVRLGLMMFVKGTGQAKDGGYVRFAIRDMDATSRAAFQSMLSGIKPVFNDQNAGQQVAAANADYGAVMYEAFKYFSNSTHYAAQADLRDYSGNGSVNVNPYTAGNLTGNAFASSGSSTYVGPLSSDTPCNKNFIIFIGNGFPSTSSVNPTTLGDAGLANFDATQIYNEGTKTTYLDEWARFLHKYGSANKPCDSGICADNLVTTYTIDVYKDHQDAEQTALLKSTASVGGGKYFAATSEAEIQDALTRILNEIQAVNSVFTSASLPVSVNTQGTYLNQIYMGVFRPDATGAPRWMGNLKQYKFGLTTDATGADVLFLSDADGKAAVNSQTGFVDPSARSYWSKSTAPAAGFWAFSPSGTGGQYDAPDGDLVEKGGAAQKLRDLGPTARNVYTCTPNCTAGDAPSFFNSSNAPLLTALTGTSSSVSSLTRSGTTVSVTTSTDLSLNSPTDSVSISGASVAAYNGLWTATKVDGTHFTFPISETPVTPATGVLITVSAGSSVSQSIAANAVTYSNGVVTVNLPAHGFINGQSVTIAGANVSAGMSSATTKCAGWTATTTCEYNGTFNVAYVDANNFTYTPPTANFGSNNAASGTTLDPPDTITLPASPVPTAAVTCINNTGTNSSVTISAITRVAGSGSRQVKVLLASLPTKCLATLTTAGSGNNGRISAITLSNTGYATLDITPTITGVGTACGATAASSTDRYVCFNVTVSATTTYATTTIIPASPATGTITATGIPTRTVSSITRTAGNASNVATVTVTTAVNHGFGAASSVTIAGADQTEYNGTKTVATDGLSIASGSNTMTFNLTTGPATPATGATAARGSSVDPATLVNWVRGVDNKEDENINSSLTDVRASVHGDVLHSRPLVINYGDAAGIYAFYGSNDGTFRGTKVGQNEATGSTDGQEVWSFVAPEHYSTLGRLYNNTPLIKYLGQSSPRTPRDYFFDGNIGVYQSADLATTHIFISMRRGGRFIYALDVSDPTAPKFLWKKSYTDAGFSELGYTWSEPKVVTLMKTAGVACRGSDPSTYVRGLVFGAGYDPASEDTASGSLRPDATMGRGVFVLNAADGSLIKLLQPPANDYVGFSNSARSYTFPSDVTLLDTDGDGCIDRIYVGDTGAKMHRFDIGDASSANWKAYTIAAFGDQGNNGGSNDRKFLYPPEVVLTVINGAQVAYVMDGTGDREQPSATAVDNRFYMIKDALAVGAAAATSTANTHAVKESQLTQISNFNASTTTIDATASTFKGWYIPYDSGEKSVNAPLTVAGTTFFGTNTPKAVDPKSCEPNLGIARGYALNFLTGTSAMGDRTGNGSINKSDMYTTFKGGGLPPSPVSGVVQISDSKTVRFIIGGGGESTSGSVIEGTKLQVNPSGIRTRVFWYFKKDE
jgi:type IV pilus assembly protein PilY1